MKIWKGIVVLLGFLAYLVFVLFHNLHLGTVIQKVLLRDEGVPKEMSVEATSLSSQQMAQAILEGKPYRVSEDSDRLLVYMGFSDENGKDICCSGTVRIYAFVSSKPFFDNEVFTSKEKVALIGSDTIKLFEGHINPLNFAKYERNMLGVIITQKFFCKRINIVKVTSNAEEKALLDARERYDFYEQKQKEDESRRGVGLSRVHPDMDILVEFVSDRGGVPLREKGLFHGSW